MDIDLLAKMVHEIMMDHDSVTLPGLGSFAAELVPATFSDKGFTINPPYRRLHFIPHQGSDTLLADLYSSSNNISVQDATRILIEYLAEMKEVLIAKKLIVFPGLGRLRATRENHFFFIADEDLDIYPAGFGLEPISLKTHEETPQEVEAAVSSLAQMLEPEPVAEPQPEPVAEPEPEPVVEEISPRAPLGRNDNDSVIPSEVEESPAKEEPKNRRRPVIWTVLIWILVALVVVVAAIAIIGRVAPEWLDYYLYSPEQLEILRGL